MVLNVSTKSDLKDPLEHQEKVMRISPTPILIMPKTHWICQVGELQEVGQRSLERH
jgi:hypothetical protein